MMWFTTVAFLGLLLGAMGDKMMDARPQNPIPMRPEEVKAVLDEEEYEELRHHDVQTRDHGCVEFPDEVEDTFHCVHIPLKNRFSGADIAPGTFFTEFQHDGTKHAWKPVITWVEYVTSKVVRACAASTGGLKGGLNKGKLRWLALYNHTQSSSEQSGAVEFSPSVHTPLVAMLAGKYCFQLNFNKVFAAVPILKFQLKLKYGKMSAQDSMVIWAKGITQSGAVVCLEEFYPWARYHSEYEIYYYGIVAGPNQDDFSVHNKVIFPMAEIYPSNHHDINNYFCKNLTLPYAYHPCPTVLVQPVEQSLAICETPLVAWVAYMKGPLLTICYGDKRGIYNNRAADVEVHLIVYGNKAPCETKNCPAGEQCIHTSWNTARCGCPSVCPSGGDKVCGTNMVTYENKCYLNKAICASGFKFEYAHKGECEEFTLDHGREQLLAVAGCEGLYCKVISTRNNIWYGHAKINVQISVNWNSNINVGANSATHDATSSWVEDVKPNSFKACVMEAGRRGLASGPNVNWFAYQGEVKDVMTKRIEVGEWRTGTHCVPFHERKPIENAMKFHPLACPKVKLEDIGKVESDKWQYDAHVMAQIYGQHHHEWFKRMLMGYGVKKMNLTNGMKLHGATVFMTVEHTENKEGLNRPQDAVNAWMEYDNATSEAYICLREMNNWDGRHKGIHVQWTLFNDSMIRSLGFSHQLKFKPHYMAPSYSNNAFCQTQKYLPDDMSLVDSATVLVSLSHHIPEHSALESMKKYQLHRMEMMKGSPIGEFDFMKKDVQESWTMPHMWRANLTGWRPHMRINENTDYSAWVEGMNLTHIKVCQKSLFSGFHYEGVMVSLFVLPDRCKAGSRLINDKLCGTYMPSCQQKATAAATCSSLGCNLALPTDCREAVWLSYLAGQNYIHLAKNDVSSEGQWVRDSGNSGTPPYTRWAPGQPSAQTISHDCAIQGGRPSDFTESDIKCDSCQSYVCVKPAPYLSCNFRKPGYCNDCGNCKKLGGIRNYSCDCIPPYGGTYCEQKRI